MLRDLLVGEGIGSLVRTSDAAAYLGVISPCKLLVRQEDLDRAASFIKDWEAGEVHYEHQDEEQDVVDR